MRTLYRAATQALVVEDTTLLWTGPAGAGAPGDVDATVDLGDAVLTPAFVDAHVHVTETGLLLHGIDLRDARSVGEVLDLVATAARTAGAAGDVTGPVLGHGWEESRLAEGRPPTAAELDRAADGRPVYLARVDVHSAVVSSALATACHTLDGWTPDGRVERDAHHAVRAATRDTLTASGRRRAQLAALRSAAAAGIAALHEMSAPHLAPEQDLRDLLALAADPDHALPDVIAYRGQLVGDERQAREVVDRLGVPLAGLAGDICVDGSVGSRTAAWHGPYADAPGTRGHLYLSVEEIRDHVAACTRAGLQAGFHVIGDAALDAARRGIRRAAEQVGIAAVRSAGHRLEHVEAVGPEGIADLADLRITASVQPAFDALWGGPSGMYADRVGAPRALAMNPLGALAAAGVPLALGSDSPVTPFDPWGAVRACVRHHVPGQRLGAAAAFAAHTAGGWRAARVERGGVLEAGTPATFTAWDVAGLPRDGDGRPDVGGDGPLPRCVLTVSRGAVLHRPG